MSQSPSETVEGRLGCSGEPQTRPSSGAVGIGQGVAGRVGARRGPACSSLRFLAPHGPAGGLPFGRHASRRGQSREGTGASPRRRPGASSAASAPAHGHPDAARCEDVQQEPGHTGAVPRGLSPPEREPLWVWSQGPGLGPTRSRSANSGWPTQGGWAGRRGGPCARPAVQPAHPQGAPASCVTPSHRRGQVESSGMMFIGRMAAGPRASRCARRPPLSGCREGAQGTATPDTCLYLAPTSELQGATAIAWRVLLEMEVHAEVRRRVRRSGWLLLCQLIQGSCAGSGVGWSGGRQLGRMARRLALMLAPLRIFCLCLGVVSHRGCQYKRAL